MSKLEVMWRLSGLCWDQQSQQLYKYTSKWWRTERQCSQDVYQEKGGGNLFLWQCEETIFATNPLYVLIMNYKDLLHNHFKSPNCSASLKAATGCLLWSAVSAQCSPWVRSVVAERHEPVTAARLWPSLTESLLGTVAGLGFGIRQADSFGGKTGRRPFKPQSDADST